MVGIICPLFGKGFRGLPKLGEDQCPCPHVLMLTDVPAASLVIHFPASILQYSTVKQ
jgi:hypothetical protein